MKQNPPWTKIHCTLLRGTRKTSISNHLQKGNDIVVLIGPEGDFSEEEVTKALQKALSPVSLGETRLRTETAAIVACHTVHVLTFNDFQNN